MRGVQKNSFHSRQDAPVICPHCGCTWALNPTSACEGYYARARAWVAARPIVRVKITYSQARDFARICALGDAWGHRLDELHASYRMVRWVGAPQFLSDREKRYRALVELLEQYAGKDIAPKDLGRRFGRLAASMPKVGRAAARETKREQLG